MSTSGISLASVRDALWRHKAFIAILLFAAVFATYRLHETPPTGYDEGILVQMAASAANHGRFDIRISPDAFTSGAYMSTGFPALAPMALSIRVFGMGILQTRLVITAFLLVLLVALYAGASRIFGKRAAILAAALMATHASLYAYGKVVLGEIPGLCYFMLFLLGLYLTEDAFRKPERDVKQILPIVIATSLALGLAAVTKPVFLVALPAAGITLLLCRKRLPVSGLTVGVSVATLLVCAAAWAATQFSPRDNFQNILLFYRNPFFIQDVGTTILANLKGLVTGSTPLYVLGLYAVWTASLAFRLRKRNDASERPSAAEACAWIFGVLILIAYLRTPGFYRYFFYANVAAIFAFPAALHTLLKNLFAYAPSWNARNVSRDLATILCAGLVAFQAYHMFTNAYISRTYKNTQLPQLERYFGTEFERWRQPYVYDAPEITPFLPVNDYSQYIEVSGVEQYAVGLPLDEALAAKPDSIILNEKRWNDERDTFSEYREIIQIEHYVVAERINNVNP